MINFLRTFPAFAHISAGILLLVLPGLLFTGHAAASEVEVKIRGEISGSSLRMFFEPETLTVASGTTVVWVNEDHGVHRIKFADSVSPSLPAHKAGREAARYSLNFSQPGRYPYNCAIHGEQMQGVIIVE